MAKKTLYSLHDVLWIFNTRFEWRNSREYWEVLGKLLDGGRDRDFRSWISTTHAGAHPTDEPSISIYERINLEGRMEKRIVHAGL